MSLDIVVSEAGPGRLRIEPRGRLDTHTSEKLEACLQATDPVEHPLQILDMEKLGYISSAGLRCIFKARKRMLTMDARLLLLRVQPPVRKVLDIIKALPENEIFADESELNAYLEGIQTQISAGSQ